MLFAARFTDHPRTSALRKLFKADHLAYLETHKDKIRLAGSLLLEQGREPAGSLWIIEAGSREEAERLCEGDPFFTEGVREQYIVYVWTRGFPGGKVEV